MTKEELIVKLNDSKLEWHPMSETPRLIQIENTIYRSYPAVLALEDGDYETGMFVIFLDEDGTSQKVGWCTLGFSLIKRETIIAWALLPLYRPEEEQEENDAEND